MPWGGGLYETEFPILGFVSLEKFNVLSTQGKVKWKEFLLRSYVCMLFIIEFVKENDLGRIEGVC